MQHQYSILSTDHHHNKCLPLLISFRFQQDTTKKAKLLPLATSSNMKLKVILTSIPLGCNGKKWDAVHHRNSHVRRMATSGVDDFVHPALPVLCPWRSRIESLGSIDTSEISSPLSSSSSSSQQDENVVVIGRCSRKIRRRFAVPRSETK